MADATFTIGSAAACSDGPCGAVSRVVVDPVARELTHLVVEPAHRSGLGRLVPLDLVEAGADEVRLRCTLAEFEKLPAAEETDFLPGGSGYEAYAAARGVLLALFRSGGRCGPLARHGQRHRHPRHAPAGRGRRPTGRARARDRWRDRQGGGFVVDRRTDTSPTCCSRRATCGDASRSPSRSAPSSTSTTASRST